MSIAGKDANGNVVNLLDEMAQSAESAHSTFGEAPKSATDITSTSEQASSTLAQSLSPTKSRSQATVPTGLHRTLRAYRKHICKEPGCGSSFNAKSHLERHYTTHSDERKFRCTIDFCLSQHKRFDNLMTHFRRHSKRLEQAGIDISHIPVPTPETTLVKKPADKFTNSPTNSTN